MKKPPTFKEKGLKNYYSRPLLRNEQKLVGIKNKKEMKDCLRVLQSTI